MGHRRRVVVEPGDGGGAAGGVDRVAGGEDFPAQARVVLEEAIPRFLEAEAAPQTKTSNQT